jgi:hypothetical protein
MCGVRWSGGALSCKHMLYAAESGLPCRASMTQLPWRSSCRRACVPLYSPWFPERCRQWKQAPMQACLPERPRFAFWPVAKRRRHVYRSTCVRDAPLCTPPIKSDRAPELQLCHVAVAFCVHSGCHAGMMSDCILAGGMRLSQALICVLLPSAHCRGCMHVFQTRWLRS